VTSLIDKLRQIADAKPGDPMPACLGDDPFDWFGPLSKLAGEAADALEPRWQPREAPPNLPDGDANKYRVDVLIQDEADNVLEGYVRYDRETMRDGEEVVMVRWYTAMHRRCRAKYWMPRPALPAPCLKQTSSKP
jgi:hypothetical protein